MTEIGQATYPDLDICLILDNGSSHRSKTTKKWVAAHPRFTLCYTPVHASWLNQVELFFSILTRRLLRRGEFTSREDLLEKIMNFIEVYDRTETLPLDLRPQPPQSRMINPRKTYRLVLQR